MCLYEHSLFVEHGGCIQCVYYPCMELSEMGIDQWFDGISSGIVFDIHEKTSVGNCSVLDLHTRGLHVVVSLVRG